MKLDMDHTQPDGNSERQDASTPASLTPTTQDAAIDAEQQRNLPTTDALADLRRLGHEHLQAKRWSAANELFTRILEHNAEDEDALLSSAVILDALGQYERMETVARTLLTVNPGSAAALAYKARALQKLERLSEATIANDQALLLDTNFPLAWINRSGLQLLQQKVPEALRSAQRAVELAPEDPRAWANKGMALLNSHLLGDALAAFDKALTYDPDHLLSLEMKGEILMHLGRMQEVITTARRLLSLNPTNINALTQSVKAMRALEMHETLKEFAEQLIQLMPDNLFAWESYMRGLRGAGKFEEAVEPIERVLELDPNNVRFWTIKADNLYRMQRYREAASVADYAIALNQEYPPARRIRERALKLMYQRKSKKK